MPHYAEFGINTFVGSPAQGEAYISSPTPRGFFSVLAWFDFESPGCAVFELRVHLVEGVKDVLRRGPSVHAVATDFLEIMQLRQKQCEREGVRYTKCSVLDAAFLVQETLELLPEKELGAMQLQPWFQGYRNFMLCVHCVMVRCMDPRYLNETDRPGLYKTEPPSGQDSKLSPSDLNSLAVQSPYILMLPNKQVSYSSRTASGDEMQGITLLLRIALYSAWWRKLRGIEDDEKKSMQNRALAFALSGGPGDARAYTTRQQLLDAVVRAHQSKKMSPELRQYLGRTGSDGFFKRWTIMYATTMAISEYVIGKSIVPLWVQKLVDRTGAEKKILFSPKTTPALSPRSTLHLSQVSTPREARVRFQCISSASSSSVSRWSLGQDTINGFPWTNVDDLKDVVVPESRNINCLLGRHFPQRHRTLVPAQDLNAHVEYTGWCYPEFEATSRGKFDFDDLEIAGKYMDAAGLSRKGTGRSVVASQPGVCARSFTPLNKRDFQTSIDNFQAELFHRDAVATTQQLYLRPELRTAHKPVHYMEAIRTALRKQA